MSFLQDIFEQIDRKSNPQYKRFDNQAARYWMPKSYIERARETNLIELASVRRSVANFVRIVTGKPIKVQYDVAGNSFTDHKVVTLSADITNDEFDAVVGLAQHEGMHIVETDKTLKAKIIGVTEQGERHPDKIQLDKKLVKQAKKLGLGENFDPEEVFSKKSDGTDLKLGDVLTNAGMDVHEFQMRLYISNLFNWIEDRRIDKVQYDRAPGYRPYYRATYNKYFNSKRVTELIKSSEYRTEDWLSYDVRITNLLNPHSDLDALKALRKVWDMIDVKKISRLGRGHKGSRNALNLAIKVYEEVSAFIDPKSQKQRQQEEKERQEKQKQEQEEMQKMMQQMAGGSGKGDQKQNDGGSGGDNEDGDQNDDNENQSGGGGNENEDKDGDKDENKDGSGKDGDEQEDKDGDEQEGSGAGNEQDDESENAGSGGDEENDENENEGDQKNDKKKSANSDDNTDDLINSQAGDQPKPEPKPMNKKELEKAKKDLRKQKEFLSGNVDKTSLSEEQGASLKAIEKSGTTYEQVGEEERGTDAQVQVIRKLTNEILKTTTRNYGANYSAGAVKEGTRLGKLLAKKLSIRNEERITEFTRKRNGKIDKRLLAGLGYGTDTVCKKVHIDSYGEALAHISIDASGSMDGNKWYNTMVSTVAICKAVDLVENLDVIVSFRATNDVNGLDVPIMFIAYDSRTEAFAKVRTVFPNITPHNYTPEGLCYEATMADILSSVAGKTGYFINYSDGCPNVYNMKMGGRATMYHSGGYGGKMAVEQTRRQVEKMRSMGIKILAFFIEGGWGSDMEDFKRMYGKDAKHIEVTNITKLAYEINKMFLSDK